MRTSLLRWTSVSPPKGLTDLSSASIAAGAPVLREERLGLEPQLTARDSAVYLLHCAAEIEHALMTQYLYAAWSLRGDRAASWRQRILAIAREEMGHLITVQNLLRLVGAPLNFEREDYPYRSDIYPFPFQLAQLDRRSLARYIVAEMPLLKHVPAQCVSLLVNEIIPLAISDKDVPVNRIGALYEAIIEIFSPTDTNPSVPSRHLADVDLVTDAAEFQARAEDWSYGNVMIPPCTTRAEALTALKQISEQGEGSELPAQFSSSHFGRFFDIFTELGSWEPPSPAPTDPTTALNPRGSYISQPEARKWAHLFNTRYRLVLGFLQHFLLLQDPLLNELGDRTLRGLLQISAFREMRRLERIGMRLLEEPLWKAGPPFELPYSLSLPDHDRDRWRLHIDVIDEAALLITDLRTNAPGPDQAFLSFVTADDAALRNLATAAMQGQQPEPPKEFLKVAAILDEAIHGVLIGVHGPFWRGLTRDEFVGYRVLGEFPIIALKPDGSASSNESLLVKALRGELPFDRQNDRPFVDPTAQFPRMPKLRPSVPDVQTRWITNWIERGCPDSSPGGSRAPIGEPVPGSAVRTTVGAKRSRFSEVKQILEDAVGAKSIGAHGSFWRTTRDQFVSFAYVGKPLLAKRPNGSFDEDESNLVKALEGRSPFGSDTGTVGALFRRMPAGRQAVSAAQILVIRQWIRDGCPDDES